MSKLGVVVPTGFEPVFQHDLNFALFYTGLEGLLSLKDRATQTSSPLRGETLRHRPAGSESVVPTLLQPARAKASQERGKK